MSGADQAGGPAAGFNPNDLAGKLVEKLGPSVVQGILEQFNTSGFGAQVNSWLGNGENKPLTIEQISTALGNQKVQEIARSLGIPADKLAELLAKSLPQAVDKASPDGTLKT